MFKSESVTCQVHTVFQDAKSCREAQSDLQSFYFFNVLCVVHMHVCALHVYRPVCREIPRLLRQIQNSPRQLVLLASILWGSLPSEARKTGRQTCPGGTRTLVLTLSEQAFQPLSHLPNSKICTLIFSYNKNHDKIIEMMFVGHVKSFLQFWNTGVQCRRQKNTSNPASSKTFNSDFTTCRSVSVFTGS